MSGNPPVPLDLALESLWHHPEVSPATSPARGGDLIISIFQSDPSIPDLPTVDQTFRWVGDSIRLPKKALDDGWMDGCDGRVSEQLDPSLSH